MGDKKIVFFCSSSDKIDPAFNEAAEKIVREACVQGYTIVSGGAKRGTMRVVADTAEKCGGRHIGVLPRFMAPFQYPRLSEVVWTDTMSQRKEIMRDGASFAIALPGGIGTLDELIETQVLSKLDKFGGRILALNLKGFYEPLKALLKHFVDTGMTDDADIRRIEFFDTADEIVSEIKT